MNNEDFYSADFTNSLPPALKNDPDMMTLAQTISAQLQTTAAEVRKNIIYARIDELDEATLDVLAYDLHVDQHTGYKKSKNQCTGIRYRNTTVYELGYYPARTVVAMVGSIYRCQAQPL